MRRLCIWSCQWIDNMDYNHIKDFLGKFKNILFEKEENIRNIVLVIKKDTNIEIANHSVKVSGNTIQIKTSPLVRSEILIKKEKILNDLFEITGFKYKDIR